MGHLRQQLQPEPRRLRWFAAVVVMVLALAGGGLWLTFAASVGGQPAASGAAIARVEARTPTVTVVRGETVRLDLDVYNGSSQQITPTSQLIGWDVVYAGQDHARRAWVAVFFEARDAAKNPRGALASITGAPASVNYTAPDRAAVVGTTVTVRAVVAKANCTAGGSSTRRPHPPADWNGPCAADFTISIVAPPTSTPTATPTIVVQPSYTLTLTQPANGALTALPEKTAYDKGDTVIVTATPRAGYRLTTWGGDCASTGATSPTCTLTMDADKTVTAVFAAAGSASCSSGVAVPDPAANGALVQDCELLLRLRDALAGTATLNWDARAAMTNWTGVTIGGTPQRVTRLSLGRQGLSGQLSGLLGNLTALTHLELHGNSLTGRIPSKLGQLVHLTHLRLRGNAFTGCIPPALWDAANHDIAALGLTTCPEPTDVSYGAHTLGAGTYKFVLREGEAPLIFDVPAGAQLEIVGIVVSDSGPGGPSFIGLILEVPSGGSWICLDVEKSEECGRRIAGGDQAGAESSDPNAATAGATGPATAGIATAFDRIAESLWTGEAP